MEQYSKIMFSDVQHSTEDIQNKLISDIFELRKGLRYKCKEYIENALYQCGGSICISDYVDIDRVVLPKVYWFLTMEEVNKLDIKGDEIKITFFNGGECLLYHTSTDEMINICEFIKKYIK